MRASDALAAAKKLCTLAQSYGCRECECGGRSSASRGQLLLL